MQDVNLPADRMIQIGDHLINVDDISTVSAKHLTAAPMLGITESKWLEIITLAGTKIAVETDMTIREFEIERAKKFTPVSEPVRETVIVNSEDGWETESVKTVWKYYDADLDHWYTARDLSDCLKQAEYLSGTYRAVMDRRITKEYRLGEE